MTTNPIIEIARESWDGDPCEWLFQLCRLWTEHASPASGTCPVDYTDPCGIETFDDSLETGEDAAYWDAVAVLLVDQGLVDVPWGESDLSPVMADWRAGNTPDGYDPDRAMGHIRVALHTFDRIYRLKDAAGMLA